MGQCSPCKLVSSDDPSNARFLALRPSSIHNLGTNYDTDLATSITRKNTVLVWTKMSQRGEFRIPGTDAEPERLKDSARK